MPSDPCLHPDHREPMVDEVRAQKDEVSLLLVPVSTPTFFVPPCLATLFSLPTPLYIAMTWSKRVLNNSSHPLGARPHAKTRRAPCPCDAPRQRCPCCPSVTHSCPYCILFPSLEKVNNAKAHAPASGKSPAVRSSLCPRVPQLEGAGEKVVGTDKVPIVVAHCGQKGT